MAKKILSKATRRYFVWENSRTCDLRVRGARIFLRETDKPLKAPVTIRTAEDQTAERVFWTCFYSWILPWSLFIFNWPSPEKKKDYLLVLRLKLLCKSIHDTLALQSHSLVHTRSVSHHRPANGPWSSPSRFWVTAVAQTGSVFSWVGKYLS